MRAFGALPSPPDPQDWRMTRIVSLVTSFEESYETEWLPPLYNQGDIGSCVAYSLKTLREIQQYKEHNRYDSLSAGFIYGNRKDDHWQGEGMYSSEALHQLKTDGVCLNALLDVNKEYKEVKGMLTERMYLNALPRIVAAYARAYTAEEAMAAIKQLGGVLMVVPIFKHFMLGSPVIDYQEDSIILGYHAIVAYGWSGYNSDKFYWKIRNSWGEEWGEQGNCLLATNYTSKPEIWAITDELDSRVDTDQEYYLKIKVGSSEIIDTETGEVIEIEESAKLVDNKPMVSINILKEVSNKEVLYDSSSQTIYINKYE